MGKLTAVAVKALREPGRHPDGEGLYLWVRESGARSWVLRIQVDGRRRDFGLGALKDVTLAEARERAADLRKQYRSGIDPVAAKRENKALKAAMPTFAEAAEQAHASLKEGWRNGKHQAQWLSTLQAYAFPKLGTLPIDKVDAGAIISALEPIWQSKPETARRVRQRIASVLDWAFSKGHRQSETPMRAISKGLAKQQGAKGHFAAMPFAAVPAFMAKLSEAETGGRLALRFAILTAARSGEVRGATWGEIDLTAAEWTLPASRMKAKRMHVVPLSAAALTVLTLAKGDREVTPADLIFPGNKGKPLSDMTLTKVLRTATTQAATVHGFRSSFRDWAADKDDARDAVVEAALAHTNQNRVEAAYRRTTFLDQRRPLMQRWADYLVPPPLGVAG